jgi:hypothetical protein
MGTQRMVNLVFQIQVAQIMCLYVLNATIDGTLTTQTNYPGKTTDTSPMNESAIMLYPVVAAGCLSMRHSRVVYLMYS